MPQPLNQHGIYDALLSGFLKTEYAGIIANEARQRGFGELRIDSITPHIVLVAQNGDPRALAEFGAFASATAGLGIHVKPLTAYPAWRRQALWDRAPALTVG